MTHFDFIEIGTSDFNTETERAKIGMRGIAVEPVREHLDRIPNPVGIIKVNAAVSNIDGSLRIHYIPKQIIEQLKLPPWIRGCNSINFPHPTVVRYLSKRDIDLDIIRTAEVPVMSVATLFSTYSVDSVSYFKVDTEGHDTVIINGLLDTSVRPRLIRFESNCLNDKEQVRKICQRLIATGYYITQTKNDTVARLAAATAGL